MLMLDIMILNCPLSHNEVSDEQVFIALCSFGYFSEAAVFI